MKIYPISSLLRSLALMCTALSSLAALAQEAPPGTGDGAIQAGTAWSGVSAVRLDVEFPGNGYHAKWLLNRCDCGDLLIESELSLPGDTEKGELLLVGRRAVLERGFKSEELQSEMSWDAPALMLQLASYLLQRSVPEGPAAVVQRTVVSIQEKKNPISLDSGNAVGGFPAPWAVSTTVEPVQETHRRFNLEFSFSVPDTPGMQEMRLKGVGDYQKRKFPLPEDMPLNDWKLSWRNPDDPARARADVSTLAQLRAVIAETPEAGTVPQ